MGHAMDGRMDDGARKPPGCCPATAGKRRKAGAAQGPIRRTQPGREPPPDRLVDIPGGTVITGTKTPFLRQDGEGILRRTKLKPYRIDPFAVTNAWFKRFVAETGYRTEAERFGWSLVFHLFVPENTPVQYVVETPWWAKVEGADWMHPYGPHSSLEGLEDHPVTHVSWNDANAFADWAGGRLPTEAEWEHAARGGLANAQYPWGETEPTDEAPLCNIWQGRFPDHNTLADGYLGTAPVKSFAPNGYGLYNMSGNVWEWCAEPFRLRSVAGAARERNRIAAADDQRLLKGGSYLCHKSYCYRYRIPARTGVSADSSTGHMGFRLVF